MTWLVGAARNASDYGIKPGLHISMLYERELEMAVATCKEMKKRGICVLIAGNYGFACTPQGADAKDIEYFVDLLAFSPLDAILAGAKYGGQIMGTNDEPCMIKEGYLADMLLVDGDPSANVRILQDHDPTLVKPDSSTSAGDALLAG